MGVIAIRILRLRKASAQDATLVAINAVGPVTVGGTRGGMDVCPHEFCTAG